MGKFNWFYSEKVKDTGKLSRWNEPESFIFTLNQKNLVKIRKYTFQHDVLSLSVHLPLCAQNYFMAVLLSNFKWAI